MIGWVLTFCFRHAAHAFTFLEILPRVGKGGAGSLVATDGSVTFTLPWTGQDLADDPVGLAEDGASKAVTGLA